MDTISIIGIVTGIFLSGGLIGFFICKSLFKPTGQIVIENNEDNTRDCIRFILDIDLEDIKAHKQIIFTVEDRTSQKTQSV